MLKENLVILRNIHGYSQEEIAEKINISRQAYAKWETGATVPDIEKCSLLAAVYGSLPALLALLARDVAAPEPACASAAASLLLLCVAHDAEGSITQFVLERTGLLATLLAAFDQLELAQLQAAQQGFHRALLLLLTLARRWPGL